MVRINVVSLVFKNATNNRAYTRCGTFTNCILRGNDNPSKLARQLVANCIQEERDDLIGYCIDDDSFNSLNVPADKIKAIH